TGNVSYTLPLAQATSSNMVLTNDGSGNLSWTTVAGAGGGTITAVGNLTSGDAFTAAAPGQYLYFTDGSGNTGKLVTPSLTANRGYALPDLGSVGSPATLAAVNYTQSFSALQNFTNASGISVGEDKTSGTANTAGTISFVSAGDNAFSTTISAGTQTGNV